MDTTKGNTEDKLLSQYEFKDPIVIPKSKEEKEILDRYQTVLLRDKDDMTKDRLNTLIDEAIQHLKMINPDWNRRWVNIYYKNKRVYDEIKAILLPIPRITSIFINEMIETRGIVVSYKESLLILKEYSKELERTNSIAFQINVIFKNRQNVEVGSFVKIKAYPKVMVHQGTSKDLLYLDGFRLDLITKEEADLSCEHLVSSYFTQDIISNLKDEDPNNLISILKSHANEEGFTLTRSKSLSDGKTKLMCYLHSKNGKNPELNTDCQFFINLRKGKESGRDIWRVSSFCLDHNHCLDPFTFVHKTINAQTKQLITEMIKCGVSNTTISKVILGTNNLLLSSYQIGLIGKEDRRIQRIAESEELRKYMIQTRGHCLFDEKVGSDFIKRKRVATFSREELDSLQMYGDFISIDPTFCFMSSNWNIIPLTVIGVDREIRSAGIVFASTVDDKTFRWILGILLDELPSKEIFSTLCSDDDTGLQGAFTQARLRPEKNEIDEKILSLKRVICFWHKKQNFISFLGSLRLPENEREKLLYFFTLMGMTRSKDTVKICMKQLNENEKVREYLENNVYDKLQFFGKSYIDFFTCGYNTSSISESINARTKKFLGKHSQTLKDIREHATFVEHNSFYNQRYMKGRKKKKALSENITEIMTKLDVTQSVAEAIAGSIEKSEKCQIEITGTQAAIVTVEKQLGFDGKYGVIDEQYEISNGHCSCLKTESTGLPCSHLIKYIIETGQDVLESIPISPRWKLVNRNLFFTKSETDSKCVEFEAQDAVPATQADRYTILQAKSKSLVSIASKSQEKFEVLNKIFIDAEKKLNDEDKDEVKDPIIIDDFSKRPGRPKVKSKEQLCCGICEEAHSTQRCPYKEEMKKFAPKGSTTDGPHHCSLCDYSGHNAAKCPAKMNWLAHRKQKEPTG